MVTLDKSDTNHQSISFPVNWPGTPPVGDVVRCVQSNVGYRFSASIAQAPGTEAGFKGDDKAFVALQSKPEIGR
jgi:hypothetical protein